MPRSIEVIVSPQGEATIQTKGFAGSECLLASNYLEDALGLVRLERKTDEFYQQQGAEQPLHQ